MHCTQPHTYMHTHTQSHTAVSEVDPVFSRCTIALRTSDLRFPYTFTRSLTHSSTHLLSLSHTIPNHAVTRRFNHSLIHYFFYSIARLLTHPLTNTPTLVPDIHHHALIIPHYIHTGMQTDGRTDRQTLIHIYVHTYIHAQTHASAPRPVLPSICNVVRGF